MTRSAPFLTAFVLPGAYTVTAQYDGFQAVTVSPVFVDVNQKVRLDDESFFGKAFSAGDPRRMRFALRFDS
ncbi:MAG: carboxypeptidase-like regulatory domain-containing protein [Bryobacteraceae bacterium]|jgi:hypothetical protein